MKHARIVPDAIVRRQPVAIRRCKSARRSRPCLTAFGQDRPADGAPLLGNRRLHLWRPQLHQPGHRVGVLSQLSPVRGWAGCSVGGVRHRRRRLPAGRHDARTAYPGSPGTRRGVSPGDLHAKEFQNGASVAWNRVPWTLSCCAHWNEESGCEADDGALNQGLPSRSVRDLSSNRCWWRMSCAPGPNCIFKSSMRANRPVPNLASRRR
jgi:hypothetical protein